MTRADRKVVNHDCEVCDQPVGAQHEDHCVIGRDEELARQKTNCRPKIVTKVVQVTLPRPTCFNCGCIVDPGVCHCGADVRYAFDPFDDWHVVGTYPPKERIEIIYGEKR